MRVQYCSDLHLEFEQNIKYFTTHPLNVSGDILILAGDVVPLHDEFLSNSFFSFVSKNYKQVFSKLNTRRERINEIDMAKFQKGVYFIEIYGDTKIQTKKIVIQ